MCLTKTEMKPQPKPKPNFRKPFGLVDQPSVLTKTEMKPKPKFSKTVSTTVWVGLSANSVPKPLTYVNMHTDLHGGSPNYVFDITFECHKLCSKHIRKYFEQSYNKRIWTLFINIRHHYYI